MPVLRAAAAIRHPLRVRGPDDFHVRPERGVVGAEVADDFAGGFLHDLDLRRVKLVFRRAEWEREPSVGRSIGLTGFRLLLRVQPDEPEKAEENRYECGSAH